jgi:hypothetical protein
MSDENPTPAATVQRHADWHLVKYGGWQISVGPDGLIMLPRHLHHRDVDEFVGCLSVAKDVAANVVAGNEEKAKVLAAHAPLNTRGAIATQGPPPPGTTRMRVTTAQERSSTIGRAKRRAAVTPTQQPAALPPKRSP